MLCNVVYIFEKPPQRVRWYVLSGLKDIHNDIERDEEIYGEVQQKRVEARKEAFENLREEMEIERREIYNIRRRNYWPTPPKMVRLRSENSAGMLRRWPRDLGNRSAYGLLMR
ncbi:MAG: hypothetical protein GY863_24665 [bacterium]|nr:hypothetical protein [bacterium]